MSGFKQFGYFSLGIIVGLGLAGVAYPIVSLIGVAVSGAETLGDLHVGWFPVKAWVSFRVATTSGSWVNQLSLLRWR